MRLTVILGAALLSSCVGFTSYDCIPGTPADQTSVLMLQSFFSVVAIDRNKVSGSFLRVPPGEHSVTVRYSGEGMRPLWEIPINAPAGGTVYLCFSGNPDLITSFVLTRQGQITAPGFAAMKARKDHSRACDTYRHVIRGDYEQTRKDLLAGADPNLKDGDGNTLLDLAIKTNNHSLIELLSAKH